MPAPAKRDDGFLFTGRAPRLPRDQESGHHQPGEDISVSTYESPHCNGISAIILTREPGGGSGKKDLRHPEQPCECGTAGFGPLFWSKYNPVDILFGIGQIVIGATVVYVAWQQHALSKRQEAVDQLWFKHELYESVHWFTERRLDS